MELDEVIYAIGKLKAYANLIDEIDTCVVESEKALIISV